MRAHAPCSERWKLRAAGLAVAGLLLALLAVWVGGLPSQAAALPGVAPAVGAAPGRAGALAMPGARTAPVARDDLYTVTVNITLTEPVPGVLKNDAGGPPLTATLVSEPASGTLKLEEDGSFSFEPQVGVVGVDAFHYQACSTDCSEPATVTLSIVPEARADSYVTTVGVTLTVEAPGVLSNDIPGSILTATLASGSGPVSGTLDFPEDGSFTYVPGAGMVGTDTFQYIACAGLCSEPVTVSLSIRPHARDDSYTTLQGQTLEVPKPGVLANDEGDPHRAEEVSGPAHGELALELDGSFRYEPEPAFVGDDTFRYKACASLFNCSDPATVTISVRPYTLYLPLVTRQWSLTWHQGVGSGGLTVYGVALCPDDCLVVYAGTDDGVYRSADGGLSWAREYLPGTPVRAVTAPPGGACQVAYAATFGVGAHQRTAAGTWEPKNAGLEGHQYLYSLAIDPLDAGILYVGTSSDGVYRWMDQAGAWAPFNDGLPVGALVTGLTALSPDGLSTLLYAGTWGQGVYSRRPADPAWLTAGLNGLNVYAVVSDALDPGLLYAATLQDGIYRRPDAGSPWSQDGLPGQTVYTLASRRYEVPYTGVNGAPPVYLRRGSGNWQPMPDQPGSAVSVRGLAVPPAPCRVRLLAGTNEGVWWYGP